MKRVPRQLSLISAGFKNISEKHPGKSLSGFLVKVIGVNLQYIADLKRITVRNC